jgi:hypothetical protein
MDEKIKATVGFHGGAFETIMYWNKKHDIWVVPDDMGNRYWNAFGLGKPDPNLSNSITCEINIPYEINRRVAGGFAEDVDGNIYLIHRGLIGGSKKGVGKTLFKNNYRGEWTGVLDDGELRYVALVGELKSNNLLQQIKDFILEVERIKDLVTEDNFSITNFKPEFSGVKEINNTKDYYSKCDHGLIVNSLATKFEKAGLKVGNDELRDLFLVNNKNEVYALFEVKTDLKSSSIYSAIGQLFYHGLDYTKMPDLYFVTPKKIDSNIEDKLKKLNIKILKFKLNKKEEIIFYELDKVITK